MQSRTISNRMSKTTAALVLALALPATSHAVDDATREALRRRIDFEQSDIVLEAKLGAQRAPAFDRDTFLARLLATTGAATFQPLADDPAGPKPERKDGRKGEQEDRRARVFDFEPDPRDPSCGVVRGRTELHHVQIRLHDRSILVRDGGSYDASAGGGPDDAKLAATTRKLLAAFGAGPEETSDFQVRTLMLGTRTEETPGTTPLPAAAAASETTALGKKVFVRRTLGGIPVAGNQAIASFGLDGRFRKLRGRWSALDATKSQLASELDREAFVARALDVLVERKVPTDSDLPIYLETYFQPSASATCGTMTVDLRGMAYVQMRGPDGEPGRVVQLDFDV